jgi:hypothetical protein
VPIFGHIILIYYDAQSTKHYFIEVATKVRATLNKYSCAEPVFGDPRLEACFAAS